MSMQFTTLTGLSYEALIEKLDAELPPEAYKEVTGAGVELTDIKPDFMRQVLEEAFGLCGIGWGYTHQPMVYEKLAEKRADKKTGELYEKVTWAAICPHFTFWYVLVEDNPQGAGLQRKFEVQGAGAGVNPNLAYALKGALTYALGSTVSQLGFQRSVYQGRRSHLTVRRPKSAAGNGNGKAVASAAPAAKAPVASKPAPVPAPAVTASAAPAPATVAPTNDAPHPLAQYMCKGGVSLSTKPADYLCWLASDSTVVAPTFKLAQAATREYLKAHPEIAAEGERLKAVRKAAQPA